MELKIRIVIAEDHTLIRKLIVDLLKQNELFEVVGETSNGRELLDLLKKIEVDIVILDIRMPVMDGTEALSIIKTRFPAIKVVILSFYNDLFYIKESVMNGARGYLTKDCLPEELEKVIINVNKHGFYLNENISRHLFSIFEQKYNKSSPKSGFTDREVEVFRELCDGKTEKEIAIKLKISPHTVHFHRTNIYAKTKAHNLAGLLKFAKESDMFI